MTGEMQLSFGKATETTTRNTAIRLRTAVAVETTRVSLAGGGVMTSSCDVVVTSRRVGVSQ